MSTEHVQVSLRACAGISLGRLVDMHSLSQRACASAKWTYTFKFLSEAVVPLYYLVVLYVSSPPDLHQQLLPMILNLWKSGDGESGGYEIIPSSSSCFNLISISLNKYNMFSCFLFVCLSLQFPLWWIRHLAR